MIMFSQIICITWIEFKLNSEVFKGSSPTSATQNVHHPSQQKKPGHPVDVVEGRRISFIPGFQDTDESCKGTVSCTLRTFWVCQFNDFKICVFFFGGGGEVDLQLLGRGYKDQNWNGSFWKHRWISGFDPRMVAHAPWMLPWSTTNSTWIHGTWNGRRKPSPLTPSRTERPAGKRPCCWHDDFVPWLRDNLES